jgi:hypothetical protein
MYDHKEKLNLEKNLPINNDSFQDFKNFEFFVNPLISFTYKT